MHPGSDPTRRIPDPTRRFETPPGLLGDRYRLDDLLGSGGMADVYRAEDLRLQRPVAVKIFRSGADPDGERRFFAEARLLANLRHPGLVAVYDFAVEDRRAYLVMELVDGATLAHELEREPYTAAAATQVGLELARVLAYLHDEGVVHRNVTPSNVLIDRDGHIRLADFGISRLVAGPAAADPTFGADLAPEQRRGEPAGPPADIYALGLVLLEAITGQGSAEVPRELPEPLRGTLVAMTADDPARRPDARQVAARLDRPVVSDEPARRSGGRTVLISLVVLAVLIIAVLALIRPGAETDPTAQPAPVTTTEQAPAEPTEEPSTTEPPEPEIVLPPLPTELPELPDLSGLPTEIPDVPQPIQDDARNAWEQFTDWLSSLF